MGQHVNRTEVPLFDDSPADVPGGSVIMRDVVSGELLEDEEETFDMNSE